MFDVHPDQIESLGSLDLVHLLRRLLHAEARAAGVQLAAVSVPLQITVPDGGEDGRITWQDGNPSTDYLPGRVNYFQCKASKIGVAGWKKECWEKSTHRKTTKLLTPALKSLISQGGCYIGFTTEAIVGPKMDDYVAGMKAAIEVAGGDPTKLSALEIYDANKIAAWATRHPSVAIWLAEKAQVALLAGYQTVESWGTRPDFCANAYADDSANRYVIGPTRAQDDSGAANSATAKAAWGRILEHVVEPGRTARVVGTSGLGKSRFVYESLRDSASQLATIVNNSTIFADYRSVSTTLLSVATRLAESSHRSLLIVDECPRDVAIELGAISGRIGSNLSIITIDTDDRPLQEAGAYLHVSLSAAGDELVEAIIRKKSSSLDKSSIKRLCGICGGYPRFAVLAAGNPEMAATALETADDVIDRILKGAAIDHVDEVRALQCLCLFESLSIEESSPVELDIVAERLARMSGDAMYEHLAKAIRNDIAGRRGDRVTAQPLPIAVRLAMRRVTVMRPSMLVNFVAIASENLALSFLRRCRHLDKSPVIVETATRLLLRNDQLQTAEMLLTSRGSAMLDALVHVIPDRVASHLEQLILPLDDTTLKSAHAARRRLVETLARLVFRSRSFEVAARLLMRLGATEIENYANNASGCFKQLFQLHLSGTEVSPDERFSILDNGIASGDDNTISLCVDALGSVFENYFSRFGDSEYIGTAPPLKDWRPSTREDMNEFYRNGLTRLASIRKSHAKFANKCESILSGAARLMLSTDLFEEYGDMLVVISEEKGDWPEAIESVGDWLYFDRDKAPPERGAYSRELYSRLFPEDLIGKAILYTKLWQTDIRDPDSVYSSADLDFGYSERAARNVAGEIALNGELTLEAVRRMAPMDLKTVYSFAEELGRRAENRLEVFKVALDIVAETRGGIPMLRGLLRGIDLVDHDLANTSFAEAADVLAERRALIDLYSVLAMDVNRLRAVVEELRSGRIRSSECVYLSYGRGLDEMLPDDVAPLLDALSECDSDGAWAALEIAMMYRHGQAVPPAHARKIATLLTLPILVGYPRDRPREAHIFEDLVERVRVTIGIDDPIALGLAEQVVRLAQSTDLDIVGTLIGTMRKIITILVTEKPLIIWSQIAHFYETATPIERGRLRRMIGPDENLFDRSHNIEAGPLFGVPEQSVLKWVDGSPDRIALLLDFYPTVSSADGGYQWHPSLTSIATRYGKSEVFTRALEKRMRPSSWSGSIVPLLEVYLGPLEEWYTHPIKSLARWAKKAHQSLENRIEREREYEVVDEMRTE